MDVEYSVKVFLPTNTQDECALYELCRFLLGVYCTLFQDTLTSQDDHYYKLKECPASGEKRYDAQ